MNKKVVTLTMSSALLALSFLILVSCQRQQTEQAQLAPYISADLLASPDHYAHVRLEDGANITIPGYAVEEETQIVLERNPEKVHTLPELGEGFTGVSAFYNVDIKKGSIVGPIEMQIPIDVASIPEENGILVALIPAENGWQALPVEIKDGIAYLITHAIGDPIIAWQFFEPIEYCEAHIGIDVYQNQQGDITITGNVTNAFYNTNTKTDDGMPQKKLVKTTTVTSPVEVELVINLGRLSEGSVTYVTTQADGFFSVSVPREQFKYGWNWVYSKADCSVARMSGFSREYEIYRYTNYTEFKLNLAETGADTVVNESSPFIDPSNPDNQGIELPDFTGQPVEDAKLWLMEHGFKYSLVEGGSVFEVGEVYAQSPQGGNQHLPHMTTVIMYHTIEKISEQTELVAQPEQTIPEGAVQIPDVVGMPFEDAVKLIKSLGFNYTWLDGKSTYDLGIVYEQAPAAGMYYVPHRTSVLLKRTVEIITEGDSLKAIFPTIVDDLWLPPAEIEKGIYSHEDHTEGLIESIVIRIPGQEFSTNYALCLDIGWILFLLFETSEDAASNFECRTCDSKDPFPGAPSGEFNNDFTLGYLYFHKDNLMSISLSFDYQEGPIVVYGSLHSCNDNMQYVSGSWNLTGDDAIAFITPIRAWLRENVKP